jgi:hypothetical protein
MNKGTIEWLYRIHQDILKTQEMIINFNEEYLKTEKKKIEIKLNNL